MTKKEETQVIELKPLSIKQARITIAGDGNGIGSGRTSGYGRYHIESVEG